MERDIDSVNGENMFSPHCHVWWSRSCRFLNNAEMCWTCLPKAKVEWAYTMNSVSDFLQLLGGKPCQYFLKLNLSTCNFQWNESLLWIPAVRVVFLSSKNPFETTAESKNEQLLVFKLIIRWIISDQMYELMGTVFFNIQLAICSF